MEALHLAFMKRDVISKRDDIPLCPKTPHPFTPSPEGEGDGG
jgi:hypothetical protein